MNGKKKQKYKATRTRRDGTVLVPNFLYIPKAADDEATRRASIHRSKSSILVEILENELTPKVAA